MHSIDIGYAIVAASATAFAFWLLVPLARRHGLIDVPHGRHDHAQPTPLVGGIGIFAGVLAAALLRGDLSTSFIAYLAAAALLLLVGIYDDRRDLPWRLRIVVQACAALILAVGGVYAHGVGNLLPLGFLAIPFSVFATVGAINAVNMIDGVDGLAGSLVLIALMFLVGAAGAAGHATLAADLLLIAGALTAFLAFNLRRPGLPAAKLFLGNSGSALLGLTVVWAAFSLAQIPGNAGAGIVAPWLVAIPLIDCVVVMLRRLLAGRSPFCADRNHLHHLLADAGWSPQQTVLAGALAALAGGAFALIWLHQSTRELPLVLIFLGLIALHFAWTRRRERAVALLRRRERTDAPQTSRTYELERERTPLRRR
jgi:UDP-GlcNAc:undecaprenyl-phosphate/decaprenyl-phosphate GlcNAc-1-phosphate transferase